MIELIKMEIKLNIFLLIDMHKDAARREFISNCVAREVGMAIIYRGKKSGYAL
jgi:hypothetical protein